jgi:hypothetical protein
VEVGQGTAFGFPSNEIRIYSGDVNENEPLKLQGSTNGTVGTTVLQAQSWDGAADVPQLQLQTGNGSGADSLAEIDAVNVLIAAPGFVTIETALMSIDGPLDATMGDGSVGTGTFRDSVDARVTAVAGTPAASAVTNTPAGNIAATNVQAALNELDTEKAPLASPTFTGTVSGITKSMVGLGSVDNTADTAKPVSTAQQTALNLKADLASPALTGNPTAPTPTAGNNSTRIATTAYADGAASATVIDSIADSDTTHAPSRNAVYDALALKAPLASPTFTGTPAAPTPSAADNTTKVATTAYVQGELTSHAATITDYTTAQTSTAYAIPTGAKYLDIEVVAGGGGGGSGRRGPSAAVRSGAGGGAGGGKATRRVSVADVAVSTLYVTVGAGGAGGAAITVDSTSGTNGTDGGLSAVRTSVSNTVSTSIVSAAGGAGGVGGTITNAAGGTAGSASEFVGGNGASQVSATGGAGSTAVVAQGAPSGGGGGGGITSTNVASNGGNGGATGGGWNGTVAGGTSGGTVTGTNASAQAVLAPGNGGGGGASSLASAGGAGGNGIRGGGGGGGGASTNGSNSGAGGNGGDGYVRITAWF